MQEIDPVVVDIINRNAVTSFTQEPIEPPIVDSWSELEQKHRNREIRNMDLEAWAQEQAQS
jgi:hypothetical protein